VVVQFTHLTNSNRKALQMSPASKSHGNKNSHTTESEWDETITIIVTALAKALGVLAWWSILFPMISVPAIVSLWLGFAFGPIFGILLATLSALALAVWSQIWLASFDEWVTARMRSKWRTWWTYRRSWTAICTLHGLTATLGERTLVPTLRSVAIGTTCDAVAVRILIGQSVADWQNKAPALAEALRAQRLTIRSTTPREIVITAHHRDALANPIALRRPTRDTRVDPARIGVGATEAGEWWRLPVLGHHILIAGATGSGKGSVLWSLLAGLAPGIWAGWIRVLVVDPKGGMEFGRGQRLFCGFAYDNNDNTLTLLRVATKIMQERAQRLRGHTRLHKPSVGEPLIVLIVDEIASLTAYIGDRKVRAEAEQLLGLLLSQGRAVGVSVIAAVQDPSKDVLPIRQLYSVRIGMRMTESSQTTMVLGAAARDAGAVCDQISTTAPGVGYVCQDGTAEPVRVRAFHVTDADIDYLTAQFAPVRKTTQR
jgi:DNA segregation ATPase FtsK/SpoIIIE, S-DNA-T family